MERLKGDIHVSQVLFGLICLLFIPMIMYEIHSIRKIDEKQTEVLGLLVELIMAGNRSMENSSHGEKVSNTFTPSTSQTFSTGSLTDKDKGLGMDIKCTDGNGKPSNGGSGSKASPSGNSGTSQSQQTASIFHSNMASTSGSSGKNVGRGSDGNDPPHKNTCLAQCANSEIPDIVTPVSQQQSHSNEGIPTDPVQEDVQEACQTMGSLSLGQSESRPQQHAGEEGSFENGCLDSITVDENRASISEPNGDSVSLPQTCSVDDEGRSNSDANSLQPVGDRTDIMASLSQSLITTCSVDEDGRSTLDASSFQQVEDRSQTSSLSTTDRSQENAFEAENLENVDQRVLTNNYGDTEARLLSFDLQSETSSTSSGSYQAEHLPVGNTSVITGVPTNVCPTDERLPFTLGIQQSLRSSENFMFHQSRNIDDQPRSHIQTSEISDEVEDLIAENQIPNQTQSTSSLDQDMDSRLRPCYSSSDTSMASTNSQGTGSIHCCDDVQHGTAIYVDERTDVVRQQENCAIPLRSGEEETQPVGASDFIFPMRREPRDSTRHIRFDLLPTNLTADQYPYIWGLHQSPRQNRLYLNPRGYYTERECDHCHRIFTQYTDGMCAVCWRPWCGTCQNRHLREPINNRADSNMQKRASGDG